MRRDLRCRGARACLSALASVAVGFGSLEAQATTVDLTLGRADQELFAHARAHQFQYRILLFPDSPFHDRLSRARLARGMVDGRRHALDGTRSGITK